VTGWMLAAGVAVIAALTKAAGPVLFGGRQPPRQVSGVLELSAPSLLAALVLTQVFTAGPQLVLDARAVGLSAAALALLARVPPLGVVLVAAAATALARAT